MPFSANRNLKYGWTDLSSPAVRDEGRNQAKCDASQSLPYNIGQQAPLQSPSIHQGYLKGTFSLRSDSTLVHRLSQQIVGSILIQIESFIIHLQ
jgi:hypothetical protein